MLALHVQKGPSPLRKVGDLSRNHYLLGNRTYLSLPNSLLCPTHDSLLVPLKPFDKTLHEYMRSHESLEIRHLLPPGAWLDRAFPISTPAASPVHPHDAQGIPGAAKDEP